MWLQDFLHERTQKVKVNGVLSDELITTIGTPQGCVLSATLFTLYTNDCISNSPSVHILKYADDTVIVGLIETENELDYRATISMFENWCRENYLLLNSKKTKEIVFDFRQKKAFEPIDRPVYFNDDTIENVDSYRYLGTEIDNKLSWEDKSKRTLTKCNQRLYFLRKLKYFHVNDRILFLFYQSIIQSTITFDSIIWFNNARQNDKQKLRRVVKQASKIMNHTVDLDEVCKERVVSKALSIMSDLTHPLNDQYIHLRSGRRLRSIKARTSRRINSFIPLFIRVVNETQ